MDGIIQIGNILTLMCNDLLELTTVFDNGDRLCIMRGSEDNVSLAKTLVSKFLESAPDILCKEVLIPKQCVGRVIGHDGKIIRSIEEKSKATVFVDLKRIERSDITLFFPPLIQMINVWRRLTDIAIIIQVRVMEQRNIDLL